MVALRMDRRLVARVDPSDVVQEALADAARELSDYLRRRPLPFYPWLRQLAWDRLVEVHRRHLKAGKRSVRREEPDVLTLPDESALELAQRLVNNSGSPSEHLLRHELRQRVRAALDRLARTDREVLVLRHLEGLTFPAVAERMGRSLDSVEKLWMRGLKRLRQEFGAGL